MNREEPRRSAEAPRPLLTLQQATIGYGHTPILAGLDLELSQGDFWGLVGPNGAGKSTLLKSLLGLLPLLSGRRATAPGLRCGYVPQRSQLDPIFPISALQVVRLGGMGPDPGGGRVLRSASRGQALEALAQVGVAELAAAPFRSLSGGQQQRVLLARALVRRPDLLVLDEPTAGMDLPSERDMLDFLVELNRTERVAMLLVVHRIELVADRASRIALISRAQGVFATGTAAEMVCGECLGRLYGRGIDVHRTGGGTMVRAQPPHAAPAADGGRR